MHGILKEIAKIFATLPGLGPRNARRIAITLALEKDNVTEVLIKLLQKMQKKIRQCKICNNLCEESSCQICSDYNREQNQICIVADIADLWAIERIGQYSGVYHVLNSHENFSESQNHTQLGEHFTESNQLQSLKESLNNEQNNVSQNNFSDIVEDDTRQAWTSGSGNCSPNFNSTFNSNRKISSLQFGFHDLEKRICASAEPIECIIAMNPTIQGQATAHYIQELLKDYEHVSISTLALGLPMGAQLDYLDSGTIAMAMTSRKELK